MSFLYGELTTIEQAWHMACAGIPSKALAVIVKFDDGTRLGGLADLARLEHLKRRGAGAAG